jgi:NAD(P)H-nitrite reductase large subunit
LRNATACSKITGGQRIDLFGATLEQLPEIWQALVEAGLKPGTPTANPCAR